MSYIFIGIYCSIFIAIGLSHYRKSGTFDAFIVAGRNKGTLLVSLSLLATILGASSTMGVAGMAYRVGFPAFWWLGAGVIGLLLQALWITKKVAGLKAYTLADVADKTLGPEARIIISFVIIIAWIGIIAAQFVAAGKIIISLTGNQNLNVVIIIISIIIILYTYLGGQLSILNTDFIQFFLLAAAISITVVFLYSGERGSISQVKVDFLNSSFNGFNLLYFVVIVGGSFFIGPDMFTRVFAAKDPRTARRSVFISAGVLALISILIVLIGLWVKDKTVLPEGSNPFAFVISSQLPVVLGLALNLGLFSAIISSADTCLISCSTIVEYDILKKTEVNLGRKIIVVVGVLSVICALFFQDIITLLINAFSIYTSGVVVPLAVGIAAHGKRSLAKGWIIAAIVCGGMLGLAANFSGYKKELALAGVCVSFIFSFIAFIAGVKQPAIESAE